jgi:hypothetical protein
MKDQKALFVIVPPLYGLGAFGFGVFFALGIVQA